MEKFKIGDTVKVVKFADTNISKFIKKNDIGVVVNIDNRLFYPIEISAHNECDYFKEDEIELVKEN